MICQQGLRDQPQYEAFNVCNISDFTSMILKSLLFKHKVRRRISTHNNNHTCCWHWGAVCVFESILFCVFALILTQAYQGIWRDWWSEMLGASWGDGQRTLRSWFTAWPDSRWHPRWVALAAALRHETWLLPKANNLRPMGFIWAHQVNSCLPEHRQLSSSLCQEPLETLYEDN